MSAKRASPDPGTNLLMNSRKIEQHPCAADFEHSPIWVDLDVD
jgi:hypothetical protein